MWGWGGFHFILDTSDESRLKIHFPSGAFAFFRLKPVLKNLPRSFDTCSPT